MRHILITHVLLVVSVCFSSALSANTPTINFGPVERWVQPVAVKPDNIEASHTNEGVQYLLSDNQVDIRPEKTKHYTHLSVKALNELGLADVSQIEVRFSPHFETLTFHTINVIREGKTLPRLEQDKVKVFQQEDQLDQKLYHEEWTALFILEDVRVGDILEFSYTVEGRNPVLGDKKFGTHSLSWGVSVQRAHLRLVTDPATPITVKTYKSEATVTEATTEFGREYQVDQYHTNAVREEDYTPQWYSPYGSLSYTEYANWAEVNEWALPLYNQPLDIPQALIEVISPMSELPQMDAVAAISQWIQDNVRYFGIELGTNSHMPSTPAETFERRYGDCKDKALLLMAALQHLGIDASAALVSSTMTKAVNDQLPSPGAFNHVIVTFELDGKRFWIDATLTNQRGNLLQMSHPDYKWALVVDEQTSALTQMVPADSSQLLGKIDVSQSINVNGKAATLSITTVYQGWQAEQFRHFINSVGTDKGSQYYLDYYSKQYTGIKIDAPMTIEELGGVNGVKVTETYALDGIGERNGSQRHVRLRANEIIDNLWLPEVRQRTAPFSLQGDLHINIAINLTTENENDIVWFDDKNVSNSANPWLTFNRAVSQEGNTLTSRFEFRSQRSDVSASNFPKYADVLDEVDSALSHVAVLNTITSQLDKKNRARSLIKKLMDKK